MRRLKIKHHHNARQLQRKSRFYRTIKKIKSLKCVDHNNGFWEISVVSDHKPLGDAAEFIEFTEYLERLTLATFGLKKKELRGGRPNFICVDDMEVKQTAKPSPPHNS